MSCRESFDTIRNNRKLMDEEYHCEYRAVI